MTPGDVARGVLLDDRYRLDDVIGQGGMATVYRGHDTVLGRDVAVKLFPPVPDDPDEVLRHQAEMRVLAQLSHPGLVTLHDAGTGYAGGPSPQTYLVMELVEGRTLADRLLDGPLPARHAARLGRQIAEALAVVHASDVVHRDIKPANVLLAEGEHPLQAEPEDPAAALTTGPIVKLADFGIARLADGARLTATGRTLGTATYLSPEQASGGAVGPASDIYALGLVLLECLTGRKAFTGTVVEVAAARLTTSPAIPSELAAEWQALLAAMTRRAPDERPAATEVALALAQVADDAVHTGDLPTTPAPPVGPLAAAASAPLPATIPPLVPPAPPRRRRSTGSDADGTHVLSTAEIRAAAERSAHAPRVRPSAAVPAAPSAGRRRRGALVTAVALVAAAAAGGGAIVLTQGGSAEAVVDAPAYPVVEGPLGEALAELQSSVEP